MFVVLRMMAMTMTMLMMVLVLLVLVVAVVVVVVAVVVTIGQNVCLYFSSDDEHGIHHLSQHSDIMKLFLEREQKKNKNKCFKNILFFVINKLNYEELLSSFRG